MAGSSAVRLLALETPGLALEGKTKGSLRTDCLGQWHTNSEGVGSDTL